MRRTGIQLIVVTAVAIAAIAVFALLRERAPRAVIVATTTSTYDSGLMDVLVEEFERNSRFTVNVIAMGTGQALSTAERGEADMVLTHAPELENQYVTEGVLVERRRLMHNDFIIVGPSEDPAAIRAIASARSALERIAQSKVLFVSRGDNSGTHILEKKLWGNVDRSAESWYIETGQGMGATLLIASAKVAYTLTDRGTYLSFADKLILEPLFEGDPLLLNVYHTMLVNPERFPKVNAEGAREFADFLSGATGQRIIGSFGQERFGVPLFTPDAPGG